MNSADFVMRFVSLVFFALLLLAPLTGELWRVSFFGFDVSPVDITLFLFLMAWFLEMGLQGRRLMWGKASRFVFLFFLIALFSLLWNAYGMPFREWSVAAAYFLRFLAYALLIFAVFHTVRSSPLWFVFPLSFALFGISILGFLQLVYFPSFLDLGMDAKGWDPHIGRLLSTWFDPNFVGGFLAYGLSVLIAVFWDRFQKERLSLSSAWFLIVIFSGLCALYLTYSRSAYLAFLVSLGLLGLFRFRALLLMVFLASLLSFSFSTRFRERVTDGLDSVRSLASATSQRPLDPTAQLRVESWGYAWTIISDHPWLGIGYNRYPFEVVRHSALLPSSHAVGGSDSSLLTLWATTGLLGVLVFIALFLQVFLLGFRRFPPSFSGSFPVALGVAAGSAGLLAHAFFVNSLLYPPIMVYLWAGFGMADVLWIRKSV